MTDPIPAPAPSAAFDHARVASLLRIIHDTVNVPGLEPIRDAASMELKKIAAPLRIAAAKEVADRKAKAAAKASEAAAKHSKFIPPVAANLSALKAAADNAEADFDRDPTPENKDKHEAAVKAYEDALKLAEADSAQHVKREDLPSQPRAIPASQVPGPTVAEPVKRV